MTPVGRWLEEQNYDLDFLAVSGPPYRKSALLRFELASVTRRDPPVAAALTLRILKPSSQPYRFSTVGQSWVENEASWKVHARNQPWSAPGAAGDVGTATLVTVPAADAGSVVLPFSSSGLSILGEYFGGARPNSGFIARETTAQDELRFSSSEAVALSDRPLLELTFDGGMKLSFRNGALPTAAYLGCTDTVIAETTDAGTSMDVAGEEAPRPAVSVLQFVLNEIPDAGMLSSARLVLQVKAGSHGKLEVRPLRRAVNLDEATWERASAAESWGNPGATSNSDRADAVGNATFSAAGELAVGLDANGLAELERSRADPSGGHGFLLVAGASTDSLSFGSPTGAVSERPALQVVFEERATNGGIVRGFGCSAVEGSGFLTLLLASGLIRRRRG